MISIAENESRSISQNIRWGYQERYKRGEYKLGNNRILGYDTINGKLVPNKDADIIRLIYSLFIIGKSIGEIARTLTEQGIKTSRGNSFTPSAILYILKNESYKGDKLLQKQAPKNFITKKTDLTIPFKSNYLTDDHKPIICREDWDFVAEKLGEKKVVAEKVGHSGGRPHFLYGKVFCECGAPMTRRTVVSHGGQKAKIWICRDKRNGRGCSGRNVKEAELLKYESASRIVVTAEGIEPT